MKEINLLPPDRRKVLHSESLLEAAIHFLRSGIIGLLLLTGVAVASIVVLVVVAGFSASATQAELDEAVARYQALRDRVVEENGVLEFVSMLGGRRIVWTKLVGQVFEAVPAGISLNDAGGTLTVENGDIDSAVMTVSGRAATRSTLVIFQEKLKSLSIVQEVESPTTNLLERTNPPFEMTVRFRVEE